MKNTLRKLFTNDRGILIALFLLLWTYLVMRALMVFYVHDELPTKWLFMTTWDCIPYKGFLGANNHFVNSFLGGLFIRLFHNDAVWIVRLPNLLAFPLFFWSLVGFKPYFKQGFNFYILLLPLVFSAFMIEFFALARGYGLSMAFFVFACLQSFKYRSTFEIHHAVLAVIAWILALYANLTLIPFAALGTVYIAVIMLKNRPFMLWLPVAAWWLIYYAVNYSFFLKKNGRLYLGDQLGFFETTVHSLSEQLWNVNHWLSDAVFVIASVFIAVQAIRLFLSIKDITDVRLFFALFFMAGIANLLLQNLILGINFPHTRGAMYLLPLFFGALAFTSDAPRIKFIGLPFAAVAVVVFFIDFNFVYSKAYPFDHFDKELLTLIPDEVNGTPPTTAGRYWAMDNAYLREHDLPYLAFQENRKKNNTLVDFYLSRHGESPEIDSLYTPVHIDEISNIALYKRNVFLKRTLIAEKEISLKGNNRYTNLSRDSVIMPSLVRIEGTLKGIDLFHEISVGISTVDTISGEALSYESFKLSFGNKINDDGSINFDFSYAQKYFAKADIFKIYVFNPHLREIEGDFKLRFYSLEGK